MHNWNRITKTALLLWKNEEKTSNIMQIQHKSEMHQRLDVYDKKEWSKINKFWHIQYNHAQNGILDGGFFSSVCPNKAKRRIFIETWCKLYLPMMYLIDRMPRLINAWFTSVAAHWFFVVLYCTIVVVVLVFVHFISDDMS